MNPRLTRFLGVSNSKLICPRCGDTKVVASYGLPPEAILKKFEIAGWQVGRQPVDDLCAKCISAALRAEPRAETDSGLSEAIWAFTKDPPPDRQIVVTMLAMIGVLEILLGRFDNFDDESREVLSQSLADFDRRMGEILPSREPPKNELTKWLENLARHQ
jgi:hypothetical protein